MSKFSERMEITKPRFAVQTESMDPDLRSCLWNVFSPLLTSYGQPYQNTKTGEMNTFVVDLWHLFFKKPLDSIPSGYRETYGTIREYFFDAFWYNVYNLLEFTANNFPTADKVAEFVKECNVVLERELSGYRFVGKQIVPMTSKEEISEVEKAMASPLNAVNIHLENAVRLMSQKTSPDYRNSIKDSISAVEAICRAVTNDKNATLGQALDKIEEQGKIKLQGALKRAFDSLYGYTSGSEGIRHALGLLEEPNLSLEEAKFMLVCCSAFVNYLVTKASKTGITLGQGNQAQA